MAAIKELDDVSSAVMCMDTLAMDSMDMRPEAFHNDENEAPPVSTGAQSMQSSNLDSGAGEKTQKDKHDIQEVKDHVIPVTQEFDFNEAKNKGYDDREDLITDPASPDPHDTPGTPGTVQEIISEDAYGLRKTKDMSMDIAEDDPEEETAYGDGGLMKDPGTLDFPGTPQEEFADDVDELDETNDMNLDETENDVEVDKGSDDQALDSDPGIPQEETPDDTNGVDETKDTNVDGTENDLEVFGAGEKSLDSEKFMAPFPVTRVKRIIKLDKDVRLVSSDAIALIAQSTVLFVQSLSSASFKVMLRTKQKTIRGPDVVLAAKSTRQFRECLGNDLVTLLEESKDTVNGEEGLVEKEFETGGEPVRKKSQHQKSAKKHHLAPPPHSRPITNFFKT